MRREAIAAVAVGVLAACSTAGAAKPVSYEELIEKLRAGEVRSLQFKQYNRITGEMESEGGTVPFQTTYPGSAENDPLLTELLEQKGVEVGLKEDRLAGMTTGVFISCFAIGLPLVTLVLLLVVNKRIKQIRDVVVGPSAQTTGPGTTTFTTQER